LHCGGVNADLISARADDGPHIIYASDATTDSKRDENGLGDVASHVQRQPAPFMTGGNVQKDQFVGPFSIVDLGLFHRIACVAQI
jgi:hypothetical protein